MLVACGRDKRATSPQDGETVARAEASRGPDPVLIRLPRSGGTVRAYVYPKLDSVVWTGHGPSVDRVLGFDPEGGALAVVNGKGQPARVDFRLGESSVASKVKLADLTAPLGTNIYGIDARGNVVRLTRAGDWSLTPPAPARAVFPEADRSVLIAAQRGDETAIWRLFPPDKVLRDTVMLPIAPRGVHAQVGDRVYFATDTALIGVRARDLSVLPPIHVAGRAVALAPTPSGDRVYVAIAGQRALAVVDRYTDKVSGNVELPGEASDLRMDGLGRYVIVRPVHGDSAWVIAVATNHIVGTAHTRWTDDLPAVAPDGAIAVLAGRDVIFLDGETLQPVRTIAGGASDYWYFTFWNGFRARAAGMDQPVSFATTDSVPPDTARAAAESARPLPDSIANIARAPSAPTSTAPIPPASSAQPGTPAPTPAPPTQFTVQFAALLVEPKARVLADSISVEGAHARVVPSQRAGTTIYRVVLGPYPSHAAADRIGHEAKRAYWIFAGAP